MNSKIKNLSSKSGTSRVSLQRKQYRVLDESTRNRRNRQQLEQLERDNFHDDPHANLVMHKKAPKFEDVKNNQSSSASSGRRFNLPRSRLLPLNVLIEEDSKNAGCNYLSIMTRSYSSSTNTPNSNLYLPIIETPVVKRNFCAVCGFKGNYACIVCGLRYCSSTCQQVHADTRCLKWTGW